MSDRATGVFYVETARDQNGEPLGEFRLVKDGCTYAYAKARSTLCTLRDLLNAPRTLEGQTVKHWNGETGVVQSVLNCETNTYLLVRKEDGTLLTWEIDGSLKVVTLDQMTVPTDEASP